MATSDAGEIEDDCLSGGGADIDSQNVHPAWMAWLRGWRLGSTLTTASTLLRRVAQQEAHRLIDGSTAMNDRSDGCGHQLRVIRLENIASDRHAGRP